MTVQKINLPQILNQQSGTPGFHASSINISIQRTGNDGLIVNYNGVNYAYVGTAKVMADKIKLELGLDIFELTEQVTPTA